MKLASVGIVTRTKDRPSLVWRSMESVLNQSYEDWRHILVNDGGNTDVLHGIIDKYETRYRGRLEVIHNPETLGAGPTLNIGAKAVDADYIIIHDDDDTWHPEFLEKSIRALEAQKKLIPSTRGVITHTTAVAEYIIGDRVIEKYRYSFNGWVKSIALTRLCVGNFIPPISFLFERQVFSKIGFFDDAINFGEDWEFYLRFISKFEIAVLPEHLAHYHIRAQSSDIYGNTVTRGIDKHRVFGTASRNELIRRDMASGKFGLGFLIAQSSRTAFWGDLRHRCWRTRHQMFAQLNGRSLMRRIRLLFRNQAS